MRYVREHGIPFLGICLGMQMAVIEYARNVMGIDDAHSTEMEPHTPNPVISMMEAQKAIIDKGGTMRLGAINPETGLVEIVELANHPWFVGVQFHPELKSTVMNPHPLFVAFVRAALSYNQQKRVPAVHTETAEVVD